VADRGRKLDQETRSRILRLRSYTPIRQIARSLHVSKNTVKRVIRTSST